MPDERYTKQEGAPDSVNWAEQLEKLPTSLRAVIVWSRLAGISGMMAVLILLVGFFIAKDLGVVEDRASHDRILMLQEMTSQTRILAGNNELLKTLTNTMTIHTANTQTIARNTCFLIPGLSSEQQRHCIAEVTDRERGKNEYID